MANDILQVLQQLMQKTRATDAAPAPMAQVQQTQMLPYRQFQPQPTSIDDEQKKIASGGNGVLGFFGGLGDTPNPVTGVADPSMLTQLNQYIMKQAQPHGYQPLPWAQGSGQSAGHNFAKFLGI